MRLLQYLGISLIVIGAIMSLLVWQEYQENKNAEPRARLWHGVDLGDPRRPWIAMLMLSIPPLLAFSLHSFFNKYWKWYRI